MSLKLSPQDYSTLRAKGFSDSEINQALGEVERDDLSNSYDRSAGSNSYDPRSYSQHSTFVSKEQDSLVKWQLELNDILERAEHILRGDIPAFEGGHLIWKDNPHPEENVLNDAGVKAVLKILAMYVNRNTILSDFENDEIRDKVFDFGRRVNNLLFMKDEAFGIDTEEKEKEKEVLICELVDIVHSTYKRALKGGERRSLREMIQISQSSQQMGSGTNVNFNTPQATRGLLNPMRYVKGKYV